MAYECNLLTAACFFDGKTNIFLICTDSKHKNRNTILVFVEPLFENYILKDEINNMSDVEEMYVQMGLQVNLKINIVLNIKTSY